MVLKNTQNGIWESTNGMPKIPKRDTNFRAATLKTFIGAPF